MKTFARKNIKIMTDILPETNNFHSVINKLTISELMSILAKKGWTIRKSAWDEYECKNDWSELTITEDNEEILISGLLKEPELNYELIVSLFRDTNGDFRTELYDQSNLLIKSNQNK
jgi:hypothetical protein